MELRETIFAHPRLVPIVNFKLLDKTDKQEIWIGELHPMAKTKQKNTNGEFVMFDRFYDPKNNDVDKMVKEYYLSKGDYFEEDVLMVPTDKIVCGYDKASSILKPDPNLFDKPRRMQ